MTRSLKLYRFLPLAMLILLSGCGEPAHTAHADASKPAITVQALTIETRPLPVLYQATGTVHARMESQIASQIMARVLTVNVHTGDAAHTGQVLISLDAQDADAGYHRAEAARAEARGSIAENDSGIAAAKASLDLANITAGRMNELYAKRSISKQELDESDAKLKTAQANYDMARARREQLDDRIAQSDAGLQQAQVARGYALVRSPFAGIITARNVEPGMLAVPGTPLLTIEANSGYRLHASVEESHIALIHRGDEVPVFLDALQREVPGRIAEIAPIEDANSHSYTVKIDLATDPAVRSGQFGHVSFSASTKSALTVPLTAVTENGQLQSVFVATGGVARSRLVTLGERHAGQVEVLSGLQNGDRVIAPAPGSLADGDSVQERP